MLFFSGIIACYILLFITFDFFSWVFPFSCLGISLESWFLLELSAYPWEF